MKMGADNPHILQFTDVDMPIRDEKDYSLVL
jgi:hypothetical protein